MYDFSTRNLKWGYYGIKIEWKDDNDFADLSHLGKPTDKRGEYVIDRAKGRLLGQYKEATVTVKWDDVPGADKNEQGWILSSTWDKAEEMILDQIKALKIDYYSPDIGDNADVHFDDDNNEFYAEISGFEILADNLGHHYRIGDYHYFDVDGNHLPHNPKNWSHCGPDIIAKVNAEDGSIEGADIRYAIEDWKRWENYNYGYWSMLGCVVTLYKDGVEISHDSLWGIESDSDKSYFAEVEEQDALSEALHYANIGLPAKELLAIAEESYA